MHISDPNTAVIAYLLPDGAAVDKFKAALLACESKCPAMIPAIESAMNYSAHRDSVFEVLSYQQK